MHKKQLTGTRQFKTAHFEIGDKLLKTRTNQSLNTETSVEASTSSLQNIGMISGHVLNAGCVDLRNTDKKQKGSCRKACTTHLQRCGPEASYTVEYLGHTQLKSRTKTKKYKTFYSIVLTVLCQRESEDGMEKEWDPPISHLGDAL